HRLAVDKLDAGEMTSRYVVHATEGVVMTPIIIGVLLIGTAVASPSTTAPEASALSNSPSKAAGAEAQASSPKLQPEVGVRTLAFVGDGKVLLSLGTNGSQLWDVSTGKLLRTYNQFPPRRAGELPLVAPFAL